jgi:acetyl-CoA carboxylase carboxyl transferase subunit alpha
MLQYSWYSVISPEGCAAILWRDNAYAPDAAEALKVTASDMLDLKLIDKIIPEPPGGAHNDYKLMAETMKKEILDALNELENLPPDELIKKRIEKFRRMGVFKE